LENWQELFPFEVLQISEFSSKTTDILKHAAVYVAIMGNISSADNFLSSPVFTDVPTFYLPS
jgi:hypothetical protein